VGKTEVVESSKILLLFSRSIKFLLCWVYFLFELPTFKLPQ